MAVDDAALAEVRPAVVAHCYRMLADGAAAEDAAQESLLKAWKAAGSFDSTRASLRTWVIGIATHHCLDVLRSAQRRQISTDFTAPNAPGDTLHTMLSPGSWVTPLPAVVDPAEVVESRASVRIAFVAALQRLPARQRAVLILRDVYGYSAAETAVLLGTGQAAVHSALQRARRSLDSRAVSDDDGPIDQDTLDALVQAFTSHDLEGMARVLHADVVQSMPPMAYWLNGRDDFLTVFAAGTGCLGHLLVPTIANGGPAFGQYAPEGDQFRPFALLTVEGAGRAITRLTTCFDQTERFAAFGLPAAIGQ